MMRKIFVIDDDPMVLFIHETVIEESDLIEPVLCFLSAEAALEAIGKHNDIKTQFLLLLDINMPAMSGWQMLDELMKHPQKENISVVMATSSINESDKEKAYSYELVSGYLSKPINAEHIESLKINSKLSGFFK